MKRGPKPKIKEKCKECDCCSSKRGYCENCYQKKLRNGSLQKIKHTVMPEQLSLQQEELLIGSMLGDGFLFKNKITHKAYFGIMRATSDRAYLEWESNIFNIFSLGIKDSITFDKRTNMKYEQSKMTTHRASVFDDYYRQWYFSGYKKIPNNLILTPLILAIWFADDGYVRNQYSPWRLSIKLSTNGFDLEDTEKICSMLCERYGEYFGISIEKNKTGGMIYGADSAARAFLNEIDFYFPESISRKATWRNPEVRFYENIPNKSIGHPTHRKSINGYRI